MCWADILAKARAKVVLSHADRLCLIESPKARNFSCTRWILRDRVRREA